MVTDGALQHLVPSHRPQLLNPTVRVASGKCRPERRKEYRVAFVRSEVTTVSAQFLRHERRMHIELARSQPQTSNLRRPTTNLRHLGLGPTTNLRHLGLGPTTNLRPVDYQPQASRTGLDYQPQASCYVSGVSVIKKLAL